MPETEDTKENKTKSLTLMISHIIAQKTMGVGVGVGAEHAQV